MGEDEDRHYAGDFFHIFANYKWVTHTKDKTTNLIVLVTPQFLRVKMVSLWVEIKKIHGSGELIFQPSVYPVWDEFDTRIEWWIDAVTCRNLLCGICVKCGLTCVSSRPPSAKFQRWICVPQTWLGFRIACVHLFTSEYKGKLCRRLPLQDGEYVGINHL